MAGKREFFSTNEVAQTLGISPFTIRRYIRLRKLKAVKLEGSYRVRQADLDLFLKAREIETEEELAAQEEADDANDQDMENEEVSDEEEEEENEETKPAQAPRRVAPAPVKILSRSRKKGLPKAYKPIRVKTPVKGSRAGSKARQHGGV